VTGVALAGDHGRTRIAFDLARPVAASARSLARPFRVIVDLAEAEFRLPAGSGQAGGGLIAGYRFGLIEAGKSRIVLDTTGPARAERVDVVPVAGAGHWRLEIDLVPDTEAALAARELAEAAAVRPAPAEAPITPLGGAPGARKPVIVVDPGHGGIDPGAEGATRLEKQIVLDVAREVQRALLATRRYEVVMTRTSDVFVALDERLRISRRHQADLFLSLHADSLASREHARSVRGATVYTLSEEASDEVARRVAEKENAVDLLAGHSVIGVGDDDVRAILIDLMRRESAIFSAEFRQALIKELRPRIAVAREPSRSGPFKVLRQPGSPAVLIELGYMSNAEDERLMGSREWQAGVSRAITAAVDDHFRRRLAGGR
jgi:N-acetylmuramoyl-L-alanine amidase